MKGGGGGRSVDIVAGHEQRLDDALEQRLLRKKTAWVRT